MPGAATPGIEKQRSEKHRNPTLCPKIARLPMVFNIGGLVMLLVRIICRFCRRIFYLCRRCYRGHAYCGDFCRIEGRLQKRRQAQRRYRQTLKGKKKHREDENRRRQKLRRQKVEKNMDDTSSTALLRWVTTMAIFVHFLGSRMKSGFGKPRCRFCGAFGRPVGRFPRRPYGNRKT